MKGTTKRMHELIITKKHTCLVIVDMQQYYLSRESSYYKYFNHLNPGCLNYIINKSNTDTIPNIHKILQYCRYHSILVLYLKLCSSKNNRNDLHPFFQKTHNHGREIGFDNIYPLCTDPIADVVEEIKPGKDDIIITKQTFSPFSQTNIYDILKKNNISTLIMTGLATSQCVETTARDASDRGFFIIQVEDAQVDYDELTHNSSLFSSQGVCGNNIYTTNYLLNKSNIT